MVTFALKDPKGKKETEIFLIFHFKTRRLRLYTGWKILPSNWNKSSRRPRKGAPKAGAITTYLNNLQKLVDGIYIEMLSGLDPVTPGMLKDRIRYELDHGGRESFMEFCDRYLKECKKSKGTKKIFRSVINLLKGYPRAKDFADINGNDKWWEQYQEYLENKRDKRTPDGCSANYIAKNMVYVKQLLRAAEKQKVTKLRAWETEYVAPTEEADVIYLGADELLAMYRKQMPRYLERARDRFLIGAFTGLRFSDFTSVTHDDVLRNMIVNRSEKTDEKTVAPTHWVVEEILAKYPDGLPRRISNKSMNQYLKLIGERAGIKEKIVVRSTHGGVRTKQTFEKWELITTHTARRSAATNMYLAGIPVKSIMTITGHRTEKSFYRYIRINQEQNAKFMASNPYFQRPGETTAPTEPSSGQPGQQGPG